MQITSKLDTKNLRLIERLAQIALTVIHKPITQIHVLCKRKKIRAYYLVMTQLT